VFTAPEAVLRGDAPLASGKEQENHDDSAMETLAQKTYRKRHFFFILKKQF
jgi:hypothetical protein